MQENQREKKSDDDSDRSDAEKPFLVPALGGGDGGSAAMVELPLFTMRDHEGAERLVWDHKTPWPETAPEHDPETISVYNFKYNNFQYITKEHFSEAREIATHYKTSPAREINIMLAIYAADDCDVVWVWRHIDMRGDRGDFDSTPEQLDRARKWAKWGRERRLKRAEMPEDPERKKIEDGLRRVREVRKKNFTEKRDRHKKIMAEVIARRRERLRERAKQENSGEAKG